MKYFSIDTETTGVNHKKCQIIQFSAVFRDTNLNIPIADIPSQHKFTVFVYHDIIKGEIYAINMNAWIFKELAKRNQTKYVKPPYPIVNSTQLWERFEKWVRTLLNASSVEALAITVAGKNFSEFDKKFINKYRPNHSRLTFHRRVLDPGAMWSTKTDEQPPNLQECLTRAGYYHTVSHDAECDALDVIKCVEKHWERTFIPIEL